MKQLFHKCLFGVLFFALFFQSCKKSEGPQGPEGPAGPQGNANVKTVTFNVVTADWKYSTGLAYLNKAIPEITTDIYNKGSVALYWQISNSWVALPVTFPSGSITQTMGYNYKADSLKVTVTNSDGSTPATLNSATFKVVVTSGS
jgi:hypothetical protein